MPSNALQTPIPVTRAMLQQAFPGNPQMALAMERLFQAASTPGAVFEPGQMIPFAGSIAPAGWLKCDGSAVSRITYAALFAAIETEWGPGDGVSTFNLPNGEERAFIGASGTIPLGTVGGADSVTLSAAELPATAAIMGTAEVGLDSGQTGTTAVVNTGGGQAIAIRPPFFAGNWLIKT